MQQQTSPVLVKFALFVRSCRRNTNCVTSEPDTVFSQPSPLLKTYYPFTTQQNFNFDQIERICRQKM